MATTSPDGIRSPNPSDPYNLVADWAITASDVQAALVKRGNMYVGTSAQRVAFTTAPEGTHWQDTNGTRWEYVRQSGAWVVATPRMASNNGVVISAPGGNTTTTLAVTFPVGLFSATPTVSIQNYSPLSTHATIATRPSSVTQSSFILNVYNTSASTTSVTLGWIAVQGS